MLMVRGLARPTIGEIEVKQMVEWALEAGFQERDAVRYEADIDNVG
jgi:hypothetical protein